MNNEINEPRVAPPKVSYPNKSTLRRVPQRTTYRARVWAIAASVAIMAGVGLSVISPQNDQTTLKIPTINLSQVTHHIDTTTQTEILPIATLDTKIQKVKKSIQIAQVEVTEQMTIEERNTQMVANIKINEPHLIALSAQDLQPIVITQPEPTPIKKENSYFRNTLDAFAIDWKEQATYRAQIMESQKNFLKEIPQRIYNIFASSKTTKNNENN